MNNVCILLTATINVKDSMVFVERRDPNVRLEDYKSALRLWLTNPAVSKLVICENSGADLKDLRVLLDEFAHRGKMVEVLSFDGHLASSGSRGKGYGDLLALKYILNNSELLASTEKFIKVTGRYYVTNIEPLVTYVNMRRDVEIVCDLSKNLSYADPRCFAGSVSFIRSYLCPLHHLVDDSNGVFLEHALALAAHRAMADGKIWSLLPCAPNVVGISGTSGVPYTTSVIRRTLREIRYKAKRWMFSY